MYPLSSFLRCIQCGCQVVSITCAGSTSKDTSGQAQLCSRVSPKRKMARGHGFLALKYIEGALPPNGAVVESLLAAPVKHVGKDAAGHIFHEFALKQSGLLGALSGSI